MTGNTIGNVDLVKQINGAAVYRLIDTQGPISRIQIAELSQLAPASVTKITRVLLERGLIKEVAHQASTGGRRAISLTTECAAFHSLAVRLGRHHLELGLFDLEGNLLLSAGHDVKYRTPESLVAALCTHIEQFLQQAKEQIKELIAIAITLPGLVQPELGQVEYMPNIVLTESLSLATIITEAFGVPCFIGNDTRAMALAELYFGASQGYHDTLLVSVHNGAGAGIIVNGQVFLGHNRNVGEIGHIQINPLGKRCQCGNFGCLETLVSNSALVAQTRELIHQGFPTNLKDTPDLYIEDICTAALNGDELAKQVLEKAGEHLGQAIAITVNLFNPQQVVISGKITQAKAIIFPAIRRCIENQSLANFHQHLTLVETELFTQRTLSAFALIKRAMRNGVLLQKLLDE